MVHANQNQIGNLQPASWMHISGRCIIDFYPSFSSPCIVWLLDRQLEFHDSLDLRLYLQSSKLLVLRITWDHSFQNQRLHEIGIIHVHHLLWEVALRRGRPRFAMRPSMGCRVQLAGFASLLHVRRRRTRRRLQERWTVEVLGQGWAAS